MPGQCEAVNCVNNTMMKETRPSFHRFPTDTDRRSKWIQALKKLNRDGSTWSPCTNARICGQHFINGHPSNDPEHPDYVPTIFKHVKTTNNSAMKRFKNLERRRKLTYSDTPSKNTDNQSADTETPESTSSDAVPLLTMASPVTVSERQSLYSEMDSLRRERDDAFEQVKELEEKLRSSSFTAASVKDNDDRCKQSTGLSWMVLITTFNFLNEFIVDRRHKAVERIDQLFLTLLKLRSGVTFDFLSIHSNIPKSTIIEIFWKWVDVMHVNLSFLIRRPDPESLYQTIPDIFRRCYPRLTYIVDCFEIFIDQPKNLMARAQTYSNYKKHNTIKVFVGCTPLGAISFISAAWGGRVTDVELIRKSGFMNPNLHNSGDQILADRGFLVEEDFAVSLGVHFIIPAFTRGKKQLSAAEVEVSRKLASVRIHIERVIGLLKNRYTILQGPLPITLIKSVKDENLGLKISNIDKILKVCASLVNLENGIV